MNKLELLHEGFRNEIDELDSLVQKSEDYLLKARKAFVMNALNTHLSNLNGLCDSLYSEFENSTEGEYEKLKQDYEILRQWINERATDEHVLDFRLRHGIDIT
jgi:hypothetical protein